MTQRRLGLVAASLVLSGALTACSGTDGAEAGEVVAAAGSAIRGGEHEVRLPTGTLRLRVARPASSVDAGATADGSALTASEGIRYVGVAWELSSDGVPVDAAGVLTGATARPRLTLVDGGERVELGEAVGTDAVFAAVPEGLADGGRLEVSFDGVAQQVPLDGGPVEHGEAGALYADAPAPAEEHDCAQPEPEPGVRLDQVCGALVVALPWVPQAGWAPPGTTWAAVRLESRLLGAEVGSGADRAAYTPTAGQASATLGGQPPRAVVEQPAVAPGDSGAWLVFEGPEGPAELSVTATYTARRTSGSQAQPASREFTTTAVVPLTS